VQLLDGIIKRGTDALLIIDLGPVDKVKPRVLSLGGQGFKVVQRAPIIV
jgi:CRISPR-associated protein Cas2